MMYRHPQRDSFGQWPRRAKLAQTRRESWTHDAVVSGERDLALISIFQNLREPRIEKDLAVSRQLNPFHPGILVKELAKILESKESAAYGRMDRTAGGWA